MSEYQNRKGMNKRAITAIVLVAVFVICALAGFFIWYANSDLKYNNELRSEYKKVMANLDKKLELILPGYNEFSTITVQAIRFVENKDNIRVEIITKGLYMGQFEDYIDAFFDISEEYYNAILLAEESNDMKIYLSAIDECLQNMTFSNERTVSRCSPNLEIEKGNAEKFNELFNLSSVHTDKNLKSVGILSQYLKYEGNKTLENGMRESMYTIKGLSFVEVEGEEGNGLLPNKKSISIVNSDAKKSKVQVYEVDFSFSFVFDPDRIFLDSNKTYKFVINDLIKGQMIPISLENIFVTHFKYVGDSPLTRMQLGVFDFKQPK